MTQITGQAPQQIQQNVIQNSPQQNAQKSVERQAQQERPSEAPANTNFQKLAEEVLAKRASGEVEQRPATDRGQVVDLLV